MGRDPETGRVHAPAPRRHRLQSIDYGRIADYAPPPPPPVTTFGEWAPRALERRAQDGLRDIHTQESLQTTHLLPAFGAMRLDAITRGHVLLWYRLLRRRRSPSTAENAYASLRVLMRMAVDAELIPATPCTLRAEERGPRTRVDGLFTLGHVYTRVELVQLLSSPRITMPDRIWHTLLALTGMRFGEGAALAVEDVDLTARCLLVRRAYSAKRKRIDGTKSGEPREVALHPILVRALRYQIEVVYPTIYGAPPGPSDLICPRLVVRGPAAGTRAPRRPESSLRRLQNYAEQLGIPRTCTQHDFRATLISLAEEDGADRWILERMTHRAGGPLGERNAYERYVRSSLEAKLREIDKLRLDVLSPAQQLRFGGGGF